MDIQATFPYFGQLNPLRVVFVQSTILNQADIGNELVLDLTLELQMVKPKLLTKFNMELQDTTVYSKWKDGTDDTML